MFITKSYLDVTDDLQNPLQIVRLRSINEMELMYNMEKKKKLSKLESC